MGDIDEITRNLRHIRQWVETIRDTAAEREKWVAAVGEVGKTLGVDLGVLAEGATRVAFELSELGAAVELEKQTVSEALRDLQTLAVELGDSLARAGSSGGVEQIAAIMKRLEGSLAEIKRGFADSETRMVDLLSAQSAVGSVLQQLMSKSRDLDASVTNSLNQLLSVVSGLETRLKSGFLDQLTQANQLLLGRLDVLSLQVEELLESDRRRGTGALSRIFGRVGPPSTAD